MTQLFLYDTESREKKPIAPIDGSTIRMYTCGPTIYDFAHIGNFRTYIFEDLLRRSLKFFGFSVQQAMNITDIDDKTIRGAIAKKMALKEYVEPYRKAFFEDLKTLCIEPVEFYPAATDYIPDMIRIIEKLFEKGYAYQSDSGSIYFSIRSFPSYGRLSHLLTSELKTNASGSNEADEYEKDSAADFVLWKRYDPERDGKIFWESPFGPGRPGWHIECSAMAIKLLGSSIDIHCGGVDNMFPHHENEIAQSECFSGYKFVRHWVHVEHLLVDHKKMSKSLGNFYTLRDLLAKKYTGSEVRYLLLSTHYRAQLNFTFASLDSVRSSLQRIEDFVIRLREVRGEALTSHLVDSASKKFQEALADDLNISAALGVLFDLIREANTLIDQGKIGQIEAQNILRLLSDWNEVLAVLPLHSAAERIPEDLTELLAQREEARKSKNWLLSDQLRDEILSHGFLIEDTPSGARLKKKSCC
ncbi:MAG: cysteine--tRNA ligase [Chlamydiae bacterium]|nr:cysteine--tRNA ligase [Chlamydiota bacterium]